MPDLLEAAKPEDGRRRPLRLHRRGGRAPRTGRGGAGTRTPSSVRARPVRPAHRHHEIRGTRADVAASMPKARATLTSRCCTIDDGSPSSLMAAPSRTMNVRTSGSRAPARFVGHPSFDHRSARCFAVELFAGEQPFVHQLGKGVDLRDRIDEQGRTRRVDRPERRRGRDSRPGRRVGPWSFSGASAGVIIVRGRHGGRRRGTGHGRAPVRNGGRGSARR